MTIIQSYKAAVKGLRTNKRRSFLTMLGLIIGIASVILVMSSGAGAQSLITSQIEQRGSNQVAVLPGASDPEGPPAQALGVVITTMTEEDKDALLEPHNVTYLQEAAAYVTGNGVLQWESETRSVTYTGASAAYQTLEKVTLDKGRFFSEAEAKEREAVLVLGSEIATDVFGNQDSIGERVKIDKQQFRVIGVLDAQGSTFFSDVDNAVIMPLRVAQYDLLGVRHVNFIRAIVSDEQHMSQTMEEVRQTLIERHEEEDFSVRNTADLLEIVTTITDALKFFLVAIAAISLFVGGVGIMNIMLIAVQEKTREIGLRKAVGAKEADILRQFLIETVVLSFIGGMIGLIIGVGLAFGLAKGVQAAGFDFAFIVSPIAIIISIVVTTLIGIVFGVYPAKKAARLDAIDALRYE